MIESSEIEKLENIQKSLHSANGISWGALVRKKDGTLEEVIRRNRPCYGEMRRYGPESTRPDDHHPGDIPDTIPGGAREAFVVPLYHQGTDHNALMEFVFSPTESPWRRGIGKDIRLIDRKDGAHRLAVMTDTEVDPTVLVDLLVVLRNLSHVSPNQIGIRKGSEFGLTDRQTLLLRFFGVTPDGYNRGYLSLGYCLNPRLDFKKFVNGDSYDLSNERTWHAEEDYNRPELANIFGKDTDNGIANRLNRPINTPHSPDWSAQHVAEAFKSVCEEHGVK